MARPAAPHKNPPSRERLEQLLTYCPEDGSMIWKERDASSFLAKEELDAKRAAVRWNSLMANKPAGGPYQGYLRCMVDGEHHFIHRLAWKIHTGENPVEIDHINGDKTDNRIENLRSVTAQVNAKNRKMYINNTSGINGVAFHKRDKVWNARIGVGEGEEISLGSYDTAEEAIIARAAAQTVLDYHQNHGKPLENRRLS